MGKRERNFFIRSWNKKSLFTTSRKIICNIHTRISNTNDYYLFASTVKWIGFVFELMWMKDLSFKGILFKIELSFFWIERGVLLVQGMDQANEERNGDHYKPSLHQKFLSGSPLISTIPPHQAYIKACNF